jgi:hypothetical protein
MQRENQARSLISMVSVEAWDESHRTALEKDPEVRRRVCQKKSKGFIVSI